MTALITPEEKLEAVAKKLEEKKAKIAADQKEAAKLLEEQREIEAEIERKEAIKKSDIKISDHAIVRYIERVQGKDLEEVREAITHEIHEHEILIGISNIKINKGGFTYVVKDSTVVTIMEKN